MRRLGSRRGLGRRPDCARPAGWGRPPDWRGARSPLAARRPGNRDASHRGREDAEGGSGSPPLARAFEELALWRADAKHTSPTDPVVHTSSGRRHNPSNLRRDVLVPAVEAANTTLEQAGISRSDTSRFTRCAARTRASGVPVAMTCAMPRIIWATKTRASLSASMRRRRSAATGLLSRSGTPTTRPLNGHKWALATLCPFL